MPIDASDKNVAALTDIMNSGSTLVSIVKEMLKTMPDSEIRQQTHDAVKKYDDAFEVIFSQMLNCDEPVTERNQDAP